jgi:hypothetical protein
MAKCLGSLIDAEWMFGLGRGCCYHIMLFANVSQVWPSVIRSIHNQLQDPNLSVPSDYLKANRLWGKAII